MQKGVCMPVMKLLTKEKEIELPSPLGKKCYFHELEVC